MRIIGHLDGETKARTFSDYLFVLGIENQVELEQGGSWAVWIHNEEQLEKARSLLGQYQQNPDEPRYRATAEAAEDLKDKRKKSRLPMKTGSRSGATSFGH